jgi:F-type H+-transporting ATPase subunit alpha
MVEILKQGLYNPVDVAGQIAIIYAGTQGHLDDLPVEALRLFEEGFYPFVERRYPRIFAEIREKQELSPGVRETLDKAIADYKAEFVAAKGIRAA